MARCKSIYFISLITISLIGLSCGPLFGQELDIEKTSPNGTYRVKIEFRIKEPKGTRDNTEHVKVQFFKGQELVDAYERENSDQYEPSIRPSTRGVEWVAENVLRIGEERSVQTFSDEVIVSNNTGEYINHVGVSYGRYELFKVFDLAPARQITLSGSPGFKPDDSFNYFLGYGGVTQGGKKFEGTMENKQRKSPADGPLRFTINISVKEND